MNGGMNAEERDQLARFLQLMVQAQAGPKDPEADALIRDALARQPDAAYLLVQRAMQLEMSQQQLQDELARLRQQAAEARTAGLPSSFFGANAWGRRPAGEGALPSSASMAAPAPAATAVQPQPSRWGSGLMGTVASTAVGVVAGSMLAQGIGSLFGGHHANAASPATDTPAIPPGAGTLVETDYGAGTGSGDGYVAGNSDPGDSGDTGDVG